MRALIDPFQPFAAHTRIDLRRRDVGMAEHLLDYAQVRTALEQMRSKRVADFVGC